MTVLKKIVNFWRFQNGSINLLRWGKLVSFFANNAAKTCLYGLKILENIEIGHVFQPRAFFHCITNLHTSCLSAFNISWFSYETRFVFKRCWIICRNIVRISIICYRWFISFKLPQTSWSIWIIIAILNQAIHRHYNIKIFRNVNVFIVYVSYAFHKWSLIF